MKEANKQEQGSYKKEANKQEQESYKKKPNLEPVPVVERMSVSANLSLK